MATKSTASFKIENNILIGKEAPIDECINIGESILNAFKSKPDFVGQVHAETGEENTFQQMRERSVKCALWLKKIGVQCNDIVVVCTSNCFDVYVPYLASLYIGAIISVQCDTDPGLHNIQCCPKVIFTDFDKLRGFRYIINKYRLSTKIVVFEDGFEQQNQIKSINVFLNDVILNDNFDKDEVDKFCCTKLESNNNTAVILFSSGSVDRIRKHVTIPYSFFTSPSSQQIPVMLPDNAGMWVESLDWNISLLLTVRCILSYVKAVKVFKYIERMGTVDEVNLPDIIRKYKINWLFVKMSTIDILIKSNFFKNCNMPSLKQLLISCKIIPLKFISNIAKELPESSTIAVYCLPETGIIALYKFNRKTFFNFYIAKNISLYFADFNIGSPVEAKTYGYIKCKSPCLTNGYFEPSTRHIQAAVDCNGWFHTNEIGFYTTDNVAILERDTDGQVMSYKNFRFSLLPIEAHLRTHPAVEDVAVVPINNVNSPTDQNPMAIIIKKKDAMVTKKEILAYVRTKLNYHMHLRAGVLFVEELPRFFTGSFDREKIRDLVYRHIQNKKK